MSKKGYKINSEYFDSVISNVPGPSPWYLVKEQPKLESKYGTLFWKEAGQKDSLVGIVLLTTPSEDSLAIFDMHCYVRTIEGTKFLVWYSPDTRIFGESKDIVTLEIIDADKLEVIKNVNETCIELRKTMRKAYYHNDAKISSFQIFKGIKIGINNIKIPNEFKRIKEILLLGLMSPVKWGTSADDTILNIALFIIKPKENIIEVIPQDWYNHGPYDFGWQSPQQVARDPISGKILGTGTRMGKFILNDTGRKVKKWIN